MGNPHHRLSSAKYPQSKGRAELAVKTAKRIILENTACGSLDTDKVARALLQYRNTPIQSIGLSSAQVLFHRQMRDPLPNHPTHRRISILYIGYGSIHMSFELFYSLMIKAFENLFFS